MYRTKDTGGTTALFSDVRVLCYVHVPKSPSISINLTSSLEFQFFVLFRPNIGFSFTGFSIELVCPVLFVH